MHRVCDGLRALPVPVIARINGYTLGAGLEVAAACDLRVAHRRAVMGMPEVQARHPVGDRGGPAAAADRLGPDARLVCPARPSAPTALAWGLVEEVVPPAELDAAVDGCWTSLLAAAPHAVRLQKQLIAGGKVSTLSQAVSAGVESFTKSFATDEPARMMHAFTSRPRG